MTPTSNYKMTKATKTWLARNKPRLSTERFSLVKKCLIAADIGSTQVVKNKKEPNNS